VRDEWGVVGVGVNVDVSAIVTVSILNIDISVWKLSKMKNPFR